MTLNRKRLVYYHHFFDPIAAKILGEQEDIELIRLDRDAPEADNWAMMSRAIGYSLGARTELVEPWFGNAELIARCPNLLAMCSIGAGYDVIDVDACNKAGIIVCNQSGTNNNAVAEHTIGLILSLSKKIGMTHRALLAESRPLDRHDYIGNDIRRKTLGIVGIGHIGGRLSQLANGFDMRVIAYDPYLTAEQIAAKGATKVEFKDLLAQSDFVSVHTPRTKETIGMFGAVEFAQMKPTAYFINAARGLIHKEADTLDALRRGVIAGAGLDVFDKEPPPPDHPLLQLPNVVATPHTAGVTHEANYDMSTGSAEQWMMILRGRVPPRLANPEVWPLYSKRFREIAGFAPDALKQ
jgi:D-3-phosphoglycerate dehydrogenase